MSRPFSYNDENFTYTHNVDPVDGVRYYLCNYLLKDI